MSGLADRRADPGFWAPPIRWNAIQARHRPACDDCLLRAHDRRGEPGRAVIQRARWRRRAGGSVTIVCSDDKGEWLAAERARAGRR